MTSDFDVKALDWDQNEDRVNLAKEVAYGIKEFVNPTINTSALDFGCGTGLVSLALSPFLKDIALIDNSKGMLEVLKSKIDKTNYHNLKIIEYDFESDPLIELRFDLIFSSMTLHHIQNIHLLFNIFYNLLNHDGVIALADLDKEDGSFHDTIFNVHKGFYRDDLEQIAKKAGFTNISFKDIYTFVRPNDFGQTNFPVFLMIAKKS
jgi:ubiquinone/menaquinone biosynthesis C-methylase UbiE